MSKYRLGPGWVDLALRTSVAVLAAVAAIGCGTAADAVDGDEPEALDTKVGQVSQKVAWSISSTLLREHHEWHGNFFDPKTGQEFLIFHREFMAKMAAEYRAAGLPPGEMTPWLVIPAELKTGALRWTTALANAELRIVNNNPPFATEEELGSFIRDTIHGWIHGAAATAYNEPGFSEIHTSPSSTLFFKVHGMVDFWWSRWLASEHLHASFPETISDHVTRLDHPLLNGRPFARLVVTHNWGRNGIFNPHNTGVWYDGSRWTIYNEDGAPMPMNLMFNIQIEGGMFTQTSYSANSGSNNFDLDLPLAQLASTRVWGTHVYNAPQVPEQASNHPFGVWFSGRRQSIFNQDLASMPSGTPYNVIIGSARGATAAFTHVASSPSSPGHTTALSHGSLNGNPSARIIVTPNWNPPGRGGVYNNHPIGVYYNGSGWSIFNEDGAAMPSGASFNVLVQ